MAAALVLDTGRHGAGLSVFAARLLQYVPLGDLALRANLISCLGTAVAMSLLARLAVEVMTLLRPPPSARQEARMFLHEPVAAAACALTAGLTLATFSVGTSGGVAAPILVVLLAALLAQLALLRDIANSAAGLGLAALAGLAPGVGPAVVPVLWPVLAGLALWALHKGARWPLLAPFCLVATAGSLFLVARAGSSGSVPLRALLVPAWSAPEGGVAVWRRALELADQVGVVGVLLAGIGLFALVTRATLVAGWLVLNLVTCLVLARLPGAAGRSILPVAVAVTCVFAGLGLVHVSARLGRARLAAAFALTVILASSPALDGGLARWRGHSLAMRLLDRALQRAEVRASVDPGTVEMAGLLQLGQALGLRPDLDLAPGATSDALPARP